MSHPPKDSLFKATTYAYRDDEDERKRAFMETNWIWRTVGTTKDYMPHVTEGTGCRSLRRLAYRALMVHSRDLTVEGLRNIPEAMAKELWAGTRRAYVAG